MKRVDIYQRTEYRQLLDDLLEANQLSYRALAQACPGILSFPLLAKILVKDNHGTYKNHQSLSPERLALLLDFFGYNQEEIQFGILLRLENDMRTLPHPRGSLGKSVLRKSVQNARRRCRKPVKAPKGRSLSPTALLIAELYEQFPPSSRPRILSAMIRQVSIASERTKDVPGSQRIREILADIKKLT